MAIIKEKTKTAFEFTSTTTTDFCTETFKFSGPFVEGLYIQITGESVFGVHENFSTYMSIEQAEEVYKLLGAAIRATKGEK